MLRITSPNSFKTCYIADVKEELGLLTRKSPNRHGVERKIKSPKEYKKFIIKAMNELEKEGIKQTYKNIQQKAFEIYKKEKENAVLGKYLGAIKTNLSPKEIKELVEDEGLIYES